MRWHGSIKSSSLALVAVALMSACSDGASTPAAAMWEPVRRSGTVH